MNKILCHKISLKNVEIEITSMFFEYKGIQLSIKNIKKKIHTSGKFAEQVIRELTYFSQVNENTCPHRSVYSSVGSIDSTEGEGREKRAEP